MDLKIDISTKEVEDYINRVEKKARNVIEVILKKSVFIVERFAKIYSPVDTGRMRASIGGGSFSGGSFSAGEGISYGANYAEIGPTVKYAKYVHARVPFMWRAHDSSLPQIQALVDRELNNVIK